MQSFIKTLIIMDNEHALKKWEAKISVIREIIDKIN